jgi:hypothetical protein
MCTEALALGVFLLRSCFSPSARRLNWIWINRFPSSERNWIFYPLDNKLAFLPVGYLVPCRPLAFLRRQHYPYCLSRPSYRPLSTIFRPPDIQPRDLDLVVSRF